MNYHDLAANADFVLDCSVAMAWCFEDEVAEYSEKVFDSLAKLRAIVPPLWLLEVSNVLLLAQRKKRISKIQLVEFKDTLSQLPIHVDYSSIHRSMSSVMQVAEETQLTIYDACYLELALHSKLPLATLDQDLIKVARQMNVKIFDID